jgi:hypothetical protein
MVGIVKIFSMVGNYSDGTFGILVMIGIQVIAGNMVMVKIFSMVGIRVMV